MSQEDTADEKSKALQYAYLLLSHRDRSISEMRRRLKSKQYSDCAADWVIARLTDDGLLDDEKLVRQYVKWSKERKPMGRRRLESELQKRGIDRQLAQRLVGEMIGRPEEEELARRAVAQRGGKPAGDISDKEQQRLLRRIFSHLMRRGFSRSLARRVLLDD